MHSLILLVFMLKYFYMFRKSKEIILPPVDINDEPLGSVPRRIIDTVEQLELDKKNDFVIVGSAALALYGITPPTQYNSRPRPRDVDLAVTYGLITSLYEEGYTPSGIPISKKEGHHPRQTILEAHPNDIDSSLLPVDFIIRFNPKIHNPEKHDDGFRKHFASNSLVIPGTDGIKVASLKHIRKELKHRHFDHKAHDDLSALDRHISSQ
jgi:hypothetical protein